MNIVKILFGVCFLLLFSPIAESQIINIADRIVKKQKGKKALETRNNETVSKINLVESEIENYLFKIYNSSDDKFQDKKLTMLIGTGCKFFTDEATFFVDKEKKHSANTSIHYYLNPFFVSHPNAKKDLYGFFLQVRKSYRFNNNPLSDKYYGKQANLMQIASDNANILVSNKARGGHSMRNIMDWYFDDFHCEDILYENLQILREKEMDDKRYSYSSLKGTYFVDKEEFLSALSGKMKFFRFGGEKTKLDIEVNNPNFNSNLTKFKTEFLKNLN